MKKHLFLFILAIATSALQAQDEDLYSMVHQDMGGYGFGIESVTQQRDGDIIAVTHISQYPVFLGNIFYKMSPRLQIVTDSVFVADTLPPYYSFFQNPNGEGNIRTNLEYVEEVDSTYVRICHFSDDGFQINHDEDVMVALRKGVAYDELDSYMIDCWGDIIMKYGIDRPDGNYDVYIARLDPNGTLKHQGLLYENVRTSLPKLRLFNVSPLQYYQWGSVASNIGPSQNLAVYVIDSLLSKNTIILDKILSEETIENGMVAYEWLNIGNTDVIPIGGDEVLVASKYVSDTNFYPLTAEYGVAVAKFDLRTNQLKDYIVFNDYPGYYHDAQCLAIMKMPDGTVYFLYNEEGYPAESVMVVKMDTDLKVEWKRFCKTENIALWGGQRPFVFLYENEEGEEEGIAWVSYGMDTNTDQYGVTYFFLKHDGTVGTNESGIEMRPYAFYPNPVKNQLLMQFSPDVQPVHIEIYDLQGRLVRTQSKAFENIDMSQLSAGTYTMRVTLEDGKAYSDKVVKE